MIKIEIKGVAEIQRKLATIQRDLQPKVLVPAMNKVAEKARAEINRAIPAEYAVKAGEVRNAVELRKASGSRLEAVIQIFGSSSKRGRSMNLIRFLAAVQAAGHAIKVRGAKGKKSDLTALKNQLGFLIKKGGGMKSIAGAFVGNRGRTIFMREGPGRLPIKPAQVIGFAQMFNSKRINRRIMDKIAADLPTEVDRAIKMLMDRGIL